MGRYPTKCVIKSGSADITTDGAAECPWFSARSAGGSIAVGEQVEVRIAADARRHSGGPATGREGGLGFIELVVRRQGRFVRWSARKRLNEQYRSDPVARSVLLEEARLAGMVRHPNVVGVLDVGIDDDGPFLIMDLVEGIPLSRVMTQAAAAQRPVPLQVALRIGMEVARGLHAAHEVRNEHGSLLGLVHGDVSPRNIIIGFDGSVRLTNFRNAWNQGQFGRCSAGISRTGISYLAPEQLKLQEPDRRSDLFSLGVMLYELLTGGGLSRIEASVGSPRPILNKPPSDPGEDLSDFLLDLGELLAEMMAQEREGRPATACEVAARLEESLAVLITRQGSATVAAYMSRNFADVAKEQQRILAASLRTACDEPATGDLWAAAGP